MRKNILPILLLLSTGSFAQSVISSVNSGAVSNNNMIFSVGEIFVLPATTPNEASSGLIAAVSRINFFVSGLGDKITSTDLRVFPNPTNSSVYFSTADNNLFRQVYVYDMQGRLVAHYPEAPASVDMSNLPKGIYSIVTDNKNIQSFKIIKQ